MAKTQLDIIKETIAKKYGENILMKLGDNVSRKEDTISSGSILLNEALGIGGYPKGRIIEVYGPEMAGKSTLALHAIAEAQKLGLKAAFIDAEHALDPDYCRSLGVDVNNLIFCQPDYAEQALDVANMLVRSSEVSLIVVDSVAALTPKVEFEGDMGDLSVGTQARMMSKAMRMLVASLSSSNCSILFINQLRSKIGIRFGSPETTSGGNALKYYASIRLDIRRTGQIKKGEDAIGNEVRVKVAKNKLAPPFRQAEFRIMFGKGIDTDHELLKLAIDHKIMTKSGSWYKMGEDSVAQGTENAVIFLAENPEIKANIQSKVLEARK